MKKTKRITALITIIALALSMMYLMVGCSSENDNPEVSLAVVHRTAGNAPSIPLNSKTINDRIYNTCYSYGDVSLISVDGNPELYYQADIPSHKGEGLSENKKKTIADNYKTEIMRQIKGCSPKVEEADTLKGITIAAKSLKGSSDTADKVLVVLDSGLSTLGYLDFSNGLLNAKTEDIVSELKKKSAIPDLSGVDVVWMYIGQTASPQPELSEKQKEKLAEIWEAIMNEANAKSITFSSDIANDPPKDGLPAVSVVDADDREITVEAEEEEVIEIIPEEPIETYVLDESRVQFVGDQAVFVDEKLARDAIKDVADELLSHPNNKVYVIGTTASGSSIEFCDQLSHDRAYRVVELLVEFGVPESQMIPMGLGFSDPWHNEDIDSYGRQIEEEASKNRKVLIVDVLSDDAAKLK